MRQKQNWIRNRETPPSFSEMGDAIGKGGKGGKAKAREGKRAAGGINFRGEIGGKMGCRWEIRVNNNGLTPLTGATGYGKGPQEDAIQDHGHVLPVVGELKNGEKGWLAIHASYRYV